MRLESARARLNRDLRVARRTRVYACVRVSSLYTLFPFFSVCSRDATNERRFLCARGEPLARQLVSARDAENRYRERARERRNENGLGGAPPPFVKIRRASYIARLCGSASIRNEGTRKYPFFREPASIALARASFFFLSTASTSGFVLIDLGKWRADIFCF